MVRLDRFILPYCVFQTMTKWNANGTVQLGMPYFCIKISGKICETIDELRFNNNI